MNSRYLLVFVFVSVIVFSVVIVNADRGFKIFNPSNNDGTFSIGLTVSRSRVIVDSATEDRIAELKEKGCTLKHRLKKSASFECPDSLEITDARKARIFKIVDLQANQQIGADNVSEVGINGNGVDVVVLDTGIDSKHIELNDSIRMCISFVSGENCDDYNGHGTHVAGIITANGVYLVNDNYATGVAPGAGIYMLKVCNSVGSCSEDDMMAAMEYAVNNLSAKIMSISIGGGNFAGHCDFDPLAAKVNWVSDNGILVVVAAGNDGKGVSTPACASKAVAVGAVDKSSVVPWWSNRGNAIDILAPGVDILSAYSCLAAGDCNSFWYAYLSGTSMSTPHVSGTAALLMNANPTLTQDQIKTALYSTATPANKCYKCSWWSRGGQCLMQSQVTCTSNIAGAGIVNAYGAYLSVVNTTIPTTSTTTTVSTTTSTTTTIPSTTTSTTIQITTTSSTLPTTTTVPTTTTTLPVPSAVFSDSFESGLGNWVQDSQRDWFTSAQRKTNGIRSAEVDGSAVDATLAIKNSIDLSGKISASLTFSWFIESNWDSGEYICLDIFSNGVWNSNVRCLDGNIDAENLWHNENVDLSSYLASDFKIRFRAMVSSGIEDGDVDNVIISAV